MELEVYKKSDFYEDYISSQKEYYERDNADAYFAERLAEKDKEIAMLKEHIINGDVSRLTWIDGCIAKDKEIAELKADYKEACDRLQTANLIKDEQIAATRHHKYKRCLAMAEWCEERSARYDLLQEHSGFSWRREIDFYFRWYQRWLKIAEQFKEAK